MGHQLACGLHGFAEAFEQINLEALQLIVGIDEVEGRISSFDGNTDRRLLSSILRKSTLAPERDEQARKDREPAPKL